MHIIKSEELEAEHPFAEQQTVCLRALKSNDHSKWEMVLLKHYFPFSVSVLNSIKVKGLI